MHCTRLGHERQEQSIVIDTFCLTFQPEHQKPTQAGPLRPCRPVDAVPAD